ncbi:protein FAF-like, chloroplastic [Durio zibethinus]|uniref:Protein FAF-like, chloroplastic n=1 Tax=Durio zibethinus TaxID=66656 RepID=A0A6P5XRV5_DURZI|nr:protein FAF-like, chloroplastic [Durio zibethinus]
MSAPLSKSLGLSSALNINEEAMVTKKQGIVSILGPDTNQRPSKAASLRRTLSADMSSKKWLTQHGFSPLKKIASSDEFPVSIIDSSSEEGDEDYEERKETEEARGQFDIWTSIQQEKNKNEHEKPVQFDIWSSIISKKAEEESKSLPPPYMHPLVKRSAGALSKKSLEICTESLGSETGSDGFSSDPPSETSDMEELDKEDDQELQQQKQERMAQLTSFDAQEPRIVKYNYDVGKKSPHRSFPPPIPSLSLKDGASVRMKTHRDNGRLVVEAVSVPSQNKFLAHRQDGRLVLTFANTTPSEAQPEVINEVMNVEEEVKEVEELEEEFESFGEEEKESEIDLDEEEEEVEESENEIEGVADRCYGIEQAPKLLNGATNVHRLAVMMNKPIWLANRNPTWPKSFDEIVKFGEESEKVEPTTTPPLAQSLPLRPRVARLIPSPPLTAAAAEAASSFNTYEYCWRRPNQSMSKAAILTPLAQQLPPLKDNSNKQLILSKNLMANDQQQLLILRGNKGDYFVPLSKGCKEPRRSLLFWEPYCIATS